MPFTKFGDYRLIDGRVVQILPLPAAVDADWIGKAVTLDGEPAKITRLSRRPGRFVIRPDAGGPAICVCWATVRYVLTCGGMFSSCCHDLED